MSAIDVTVRAERPNCSARLVERCVRDGRAELDDIRRAASALSSLDLLVLLGVDVRGAVRQAGGGVLVSCFAPGHSDRSPSCSVRPTPDGQHAMRCFGCDASAGDVLGVAEHAFGMYAAASFPELKRRLAELLGVSSSSASHVSSVERGTAGLARARTPEPPRFDLDPLVRVLAWQGRLDGRNPIAAAVEGYLTRRGLLEVARAAGCFALPPFEAAVGVLEDAFGLDTLRASGLLDERGGAWTASGHRLCIPWRNEEGCVTTLQRRCLDSGRPKYVSPLGLGPLAPFGAELVRFANPGAGLVLTEGALDALALRGLDPRTDRVVLGLQGVGGWRDAWTHVARGRDVWIAFDADHAGDEAAPVLRDRLLEGGARSVRRMRPGNGAKDWAELLERRRAPAVERVA